MTAIEMMIICFEGFDIRSFEDRIFKVLNVRTFKTSIFRRNFEESKLCKSL